MATTIEGFNILTSRGLKRSTAAATTIPELAAVIPSNEARTILYRFKAFQNRYTKKIKKVPGKNIPAAATIPPIIFPNKPYSRNDKAPMNELNENTGPGTA